MMPCCQVGLSHLHRPRTSRWNRATPAGPQRRLSRDMPSRLVGRSQRWISVGVRDVSFPGSPPTAGPPKPSSWMRRMPGTSLAPALQRENRGRGHASTCSCVRVSLDGCHPALRTAVCSESVASKPHGTGLDVRQTEEPFRDGPGRELVSASGSTSVFRGPCVLQGVGPLHAGVAGPVLGCVLSCCQSEPGASLSRGRNTTLDGKDGRLPPCPLNLARAPREADAARATLDWDWIGNRLGPDWAVAAFEEDQGCWCN